jgi:serine protease
MAAKRKASATKPGSSQTGFRPRAVVKFRDSVVLPYVDGVESQFERLKVGPYERLKRAFPNVHFTRMFTAVDANRLVEMVDRARAMDADYRPPNLLSYFILEAPGSDVEALVKELLTWDAVQTAYADTPAADPLVNPADDIRSGNQGYLNPAPDGIDAEFAWTQAGGDGVGVNFIDLEQGWTLNHEDLAAHGASLLFGTLVNGSRPHGTAVLGEVCAIDNALGCVGIVPNIASVNVVSHSGSLANVPDCIVAAVANLGFGDVLLLEVQTTAAFGFPVETLPPSFDAIRLATALGIVVIEAGGNGSNNLDNFTDAGGLRMLDRTSADFRDSGAIVVGAGSSTTPHTRLGFSSFGNRVDCYGWGENVDTSSSNSAGATTLYTAVFNGTSSASPIVAGAALAVQGMAEATLGFRFSPRQLRAILSDPATGTASNNPASDRIGMMPNLRGIAETVLATAPDVYLRDFVGDVGDPHAGAISASPDIILLKAPQANPQLAFGEGSGTENSNALGAEAEAGQDNFVYVRVRNRGGSAAASVVADVFWSPPSTLVTPPWTAVGSVTLPSVPAGNVLTVSNAITWPAAQVPGTGHYCFVGLIGNAADPAPAPADFLNWDNYQRFIRDNNNVTWRNFNVVDVDPSAGPDPEYAVAAFLVRGAPDKARFFELESVARMPEGARVLLEAPEFFLDSLRHPKAQAAWDKKSRTVRVPLSPHGAYKWGQALLKAQARIPVRLLVAVPKARRNAAYEVYVRQLYEGREVGRITWRFAPKPDAGAKAKARAKPKARSKAKARSRKR